MVAFPVSLVAVPVGMARFIKETSDSAFSSDKSNLNRILRTGS